MKALLTVLMVIAGIVSAGLVIERGLLDGPQHYATADQPVQGASSGPPLQPRG